MIVDKVTLLNETVFDVLNETNEKKIFKTFMNVGLKVLGADYGFAWQLKDLKSKQLELVCKSPNLPFTPTARKKGRNYYVIKTHIPIFVEDINQTPDVNYVSKYFTSYAIIPLVHKRGVHGSIVFCFKHLEKFSKEKRTLAVLLGNSAAQAITIRRLIKKEKESQKIKEKQKSTEMLLSQERLKSEFIANAAHELRTPLAIIKGNIDLAVHGRGRELKPIKEIIYDIDQETKHLSNIISDLALLTSRNRNFNNEVSKNKVDLKQLITEVAGRAKALAFKKNISIKLKTLPAMGIYGHREYLTKMLANLIKNAINYGKVGGWVEIGAKKENGFIFISVKDNGMGIQAADLPHVFERFYRGDKSHSSEQVEGTGLGLPIVKWVAENHGGEVSVSSAETKGSTFIVKLPLRVKIAAK